MLSFLAWLQALNHQIHVILPKRSKPHHDYITGVINKLTNATNQLKALISLAEDDHSSNKYYLEQKRAATHCINKLELNNTYKIAKYGPSVMYFIADKVNKIPYENVADCLLIGNRRSERI